MKFLRHLLVMLAATAFTLWVILLTIDTSLIPSASWLAAADKVNFYTDLSKGLPDILAGGGSAEAAATRAQMMTVLTPTAMKADLRDYLPRVEDYARGIGPAPEQPFQLTIGRYLKSQGGSPKAKVPAANPKPAAAQTNLVWVGRILAQKWWLLAIGVLLAGLALLSAPAPARPGVVAQIGLWVAINTGLWYLTLRALPAMITGTIAHASPEMANIMPLFDPLLIAIAAQALAVTLKTLLYSASAVGLGLVAAIILRVSRPKLGAQPTNLPVERD